MSTKATTRSKSKSKAQLVAKASRKQIDRLIELLETRPDIAKGFARGNTSSFWNDVQTKLNDLGPTEKDVTGWRRVWVDYKFNLKRKMSNNKKELAATGGGPNQYDELTATESRASYIAGLEAAVDGIDDTSAFGVEDSYSEELGDAGSLEKNRNSEADEIVIEHKKKKPRRMSSMELLQYQVDEQETYHQKASANSMALSKKISDVSHYCRQISKAISELSNTEKAKLEEIKRHNLRVEHLVLEKLKLKQKLLELELKRVKKS